jgi:hypothetical protein
LHGSGSVILSIIIIQICAVNIPAIGHCVLNVYTNNNSKLITMLKRWGETP